LANLFLKTVVFFIFSYVPIEPSKQVINQRDYIMKITKVQQRKISRLNYYLTYVAMFLTVTVLPLPLMALFVTYFSTIPVVLFFTAIITTLVMVAILWTQISLNQ
jgi:hypothetical protein